MKLPVKPVWLKDPTQVSLGLLSLPTSASLCTKWESNPLKSRALLTIIVGGHGYLSSTCSDEFFSLSLKFEFEFYEFFIEWIKLRIYCASGLSSTDSIKITHARTLEIHE
ncbi:hypothetical protein Hanom_Chr06g00533561 [Helianthus anomalus]